MSVKSGDSLLKDLVTLEKLESTLESCRQVTQDILEQLSALETQIDSHHGKVLAAKTSGTTATTVGTGLAITGLIMAPFTFGTSLIVSTVGAVTSVGGATANLITDVVDRKKRHKFIENIQTLAEKQQSSKEDLLILVEDLDSAVSSFIENDGLSEMEAMYAVLNGDRCAERQVDSSDSDCSERLLDFEWVDNPKAWKPAVKRFCFKAGMNSFKIVKSSRALTALAGSGRSLAMTGARSANAGAIATTNTASGIGRVVGTAAFRGTMVVAGVIFTTIDIALLVKEWKALNPTKETVKAVIEEISEELHQYSQLLSKLETIRTCQFFCGTFHSIPIVGTSPFAVEALLSLCHLQFEKVHKIYGTNTLDLHEEGEAPTYQTVLSIIRSYDLCVGHGVLESLEELLATCSSSSASGERAPAQKDAGNKNLVEPVISLNTVKFPVSDDPVRVPAFDSEVLNINKSIIDEFLSHEGYPSFAALSHYLSGTTIMEDYHCPLPGNIVHTINHVSIAYSKYCGYLNANKFEYIVTLHNLKQLAIYYLKQEISNCKRAGITDDDDEGLGNSSPEEEVLSSSSSCEPINDTVEILLNHKSFIDPVAVAILQKNSEQQATFQNTFTTVCNHFSHLQFKLPVWALDLNVALVKDASEQQQRPH